MSVFEVQTQLIYGWENCWEQYDNPRQFETKEEAQKELDEFHEDCTEAFELGHLDDKPNKGDLRIVLVTESKHYTLA